MAPEYWRRGYLEAPRDIWLRVPLVTALVRAAAAARRFGDYGLLLWDGWRPPVLQASLYEEYREQLAGQADGEELDRLVARFVTDPTRLDPPPAHSTGGAINLTLCDLLTGEPTDMGGEFDELSDRSEPSFYDERDDAASVTYARHRGALSEAMTESGFVQLPSEWWHFELGTALWAQHTGEPVKFAVVSMSD